MQILPLASLILAVVAGEIASASANVALNPLFGDRRVIQRDKTLAIWGTAEPGETLTLTFKNQVRTAQADRAGNWQVGLAPLAWPVPVGRSSASLRRIVLKA